MFDLPELLDHILLHVCDSESKSEAKIDATEDKIGPLKRLFVLQTVNHTFHNTISRSKSMQRVMFLEDPPSRSVETPGLGPSRCVLRYPFSFLWLLQEGAIRRNGRELRVKQGYLEFCDMSRSQYMDTAREASWRKIELLGVSDPELSFRLRPNCDTHDLHLRSIDRGDSTTLGQVYDGLLSLIPFLGAYENAVALYWQYHRIDAPETTEAANAVDEAYFRLEKKCARKRLWG